MPASKIIPASSPHGVSAGAAAAVLTHVPPWPGRLQLSSTPVHAVSQQTPSPQKVVTHSLPVVQAPPCGTAVLVGVAVTVAVAVAVPVAVAVEMGVTVGVVVGVCVGGHTG